MLNAAIQDILNDTVTNDTLDELKALQADLDGILYNDKSPLSNAWKSGKVQRAYILLHIHFTTSTV